MTDSSLPGVPVLINGEFRQSKASRWRDLVNPATQEKIARVPMCTADEVAEARAEKPA